ncbi:MAG: DUF4286 family protein [Muribaculaceae bacterium]|nr:DUF4286 family protein [Muribaculaceae bacterium]
MYTYNITFVVAPDREKDLLDFLRNDLIPQVFNEESPAKSPELKKVVEAGGEKPGPDHGLSIALSATLPTEETAHLWNDHTLLAALGDFHLKFGDHALFFVTLLENIYI